jgi:hypothetical protein
MIWISVRAFIAFFHLLYLNNPYFSIKVEQHPVRPHPQPISIFVVNKGLDAWAVRHGRQAVHGSTNCRIALVVELTELAKRFDMPLDTVHE